MKKLFFILLLFLTTSVSAENKLLNNIRTDSKELVSTIYNDSKNVVTTVYEDSKDAISELYPDVKSAIVSIAQGIGVASEHVYKVLVKKYVVTGIKELLLFVFFILIFISGVFFTAKYIKNNTCITWKLIPCVLMVILGLFTLSKVNYDDMLMGLINPEFGALNYILEYVKTMV